MRVALKTKKLPKVSMNHSPAAQTKRAVTIIKRLEKATVGMVEPMSLTIKKEFGNDPFLILISCLLSLRARDVMTLPLSCELFKRAHTPKGIIEYPLKDLEKLLRPIGFYRHKAKLIKDVSLVILERFHGKVPHTLEELRSIKGVGLKTANLVLGEAFGIPALCVDTHVHRISNRLGLVATKTPDQTEAALQKIIPKKYWIRYNHLMVMWGQNICVPISPKCSQCVLVDICPRTGVVKNR
jgi:endonuclease-3